MNVSLACPPEPLAFRVRVACSVALGVCLSCTLPSDPSSDILTAETWPAADALFQNDDMWLTGDGLYSVDLANGRVLWLFGDSFIATSTERRRSESVIVRNSVAIQSGYNPSTASIAFYWDDSHHEPESFFADQGDTWFWPGDAVLLNGGLLIFLIRIRAVDSALGFEGIGWEAVLVSNPGDNPDEWVWTWAQTPADAFDVHLGSGAVLVEGDFVYAFGAEQATSGNTHLVRWPISQVGQANLADPVWWTGASTGWVEHRALSDKPTPILRDGQSEFTLHYEPALGRYLQIQTVGFGAADIGLRTAPSITGPYSALEAFYRPDERDHPGAFIYEGKAHPELSGADIVLTYFPSNFDFSALVNDMSRGWPRFLRAKITTP